VLKSLAGMAGVLAMAVATAVAADAGQWSRVLGLRAGTRITIDLADQRRVEGRAVRASEVDLTYQALREVTVARDDVVCVRKGPRLSRAMSTLLGAAIGLGGGAIVNATLGRYFSNEGHDITAATLGAGAAAGAGIGAITGWRLQDHLPTPGR